MRAETTSASARRTAARAGRVRCSASLEHRAESARSSRTQLGSGDGRGAYLLEPRPRPLPEAWDLQRSLAGAVSQGAIPDTVDTSSSIRRSITLGRRTDEDELHVPDGADVEIVETDRGGKSTYHGPGQLVCYPILDLTRHGQRREALLPRPRGGADPDAARLGVEATRIEGLTGVWLRPPIPRKIASIGVHISQWVTTHGYALNVDLDPAPFTSGSRRAGSRTRRSRRSRASSAGRSPSTRCARTRGALAEVFELAFDELPAEDGAGLWPQPVHAKLAGASRPATSAPGSGAGRVAQDRRDPLQRATASGGSRRSSGLPSDLGASRPGRRARPALAAAVRLATAHRLGLHAGACFARPRRPDRRSPPAPAARAHGEHDSRSLPRADDDVLRPRRAVEEVPRPQLPLLALDDRAGTSRRARGSPPARLASGTSPIG